MPQINNHELNSREIAVVDKLWNSVFRGNFSLYDDTLIVTSIVTTLNLSWYFEYSSVMGHIPQTLSAFGTWLKDDRASMMNAYKLSSSALPPVEQYLQIFMIAMSLGQTCMLYTLYTELNFPYGDSLDGLYRWLKSDTVGGALSLITIYLKYVL